MKIKLFKPKRIIPFLSFVLIAVFLMASCEKEQATELKAEGGEFSIGSISDIDAPLEGDSRTYEVKSDGYWMVDFVDENDWIKVEPMEGEGNGSFTVTVDKNRTENERFNGLTFRVNMNRTKDLINIRQDLNPDPPYFEILDFEEEVLVHGDGEILSYQISSNTDWEVFVREGDEWVGAEPKSDFGDGFFTLDIEENPDYTIRATAVTFTMDGVPAKDTLTIRQEGKIDDNIVLYEDFSWMTAGDYVFYTVTGEKRMDTWTEEEMAHGWTSTVNTVEGSGNQMLVYGRPGYVKLGKTNYGGDLISPKLSRIDGTKDVTVTFKAAPYRTAAGTRDDTILKVNVIGPGEITTTDTFNIDNWPDFDAGRDPVDVVDDVWAAPEAVRTFKIKGATSETQIRFLGNAFDLRNNEPNKNRIFLDDIIVILD